MLSRQTTVALLLLVMAIGCQDKGTANADSTRQSLPPVYSLGPLANTNWNPAAGPIMIVSDEGSSDTAIVVFPEATDSTIASFQGISPPSGLTFDLFGRNGKVASSMAATPLPSLDASRDCHSWPLARLRSVRSNWGVGFASGQVHAVVLDSIEVVSTTDSAELAAAVARTAATLPVATDPTFRGLPFRVRSAFTFRLDSVDVVIADVVRSVNEEANPRLEHILLVGEKPTTTRDKYDVGYYSRTAGAEESTQATEVLAVVRLGSPRRPALVVNIEYDDRSRFGLIERTAPGRWRATWRSAYTDC